MQHQSMRNQQKSNGGSKPAFTLLELMVSMTVLSLIMLLVFQMLDTTQKTFQSSRARASTFKEARVAFEGITRRVGQAMLNTYFDYKYPNNNPLGTPTGYERKSDLHFISGRASTLLRGVKYSSHCVFFQAPLGFSLRPENQSLGSLLNSWGYFIERDNDDDQVPQFLKSYNGMDSSRERYRLMEFRPPTENMEVYGANLRNRYSIDWFKNQISLSSAGGVPFSRPLAENIIALIIEPKRSEKTGTAAVLAPRYEYDSRRFQKSNSPRDETKHQLPPLIEITMVAIDERSVIRNEQMNGGSLEELVSTSLFNNAASYEADLQTLENSLVEKRITYRVFNETVAIRASKFSDPQFVR
jgi:uncharacterized protein (TIGR02599 family)